MRKGFCFLSIMLVWGVSALIIFDLLERNISEEMITSKKGFAYEAICISSRSTQSIKFRVDYSDGNGVIEDAFSLPITHVCDDSYTKLFKQKNVKVFYHDNLYLGLEVGGVMIQSVEQGMELFSSKGGAIFFTVFLALIISLALIASYGKSERKPQKTGDRPEWH